MAKKKKQKGVKFVLGPACGRSLMLALAFVAFVSTAHAQEPHRLTVPRLVLVGGQSLDTVTTLMNLHRGCYEANPFYGRHPSAGRLIVTKASITAVNWVAMTAMEKIGWHKGAAVLGYVAGGVGVSAGVWNLSLRCR